MVVRLPHSIFNQEILIKKKKDFFKNFYLVPKFIDSLNICFMMKKKYYKDLWAISTFSPNLSHYRICVVLETVLAIL